MALEFSQKKALATTGVFSLVLLLLWGFPYTWYARATPGQEFLWLAERTNLVNWTYRPSPISESAESILVADRLVNGEFRNAGGRVLRVFSAKRYKDNRNEIGLFEHTPDRCWTQVGWKIEPLSPDLVELDIHGVKVAYERRVFSFEGQRELVYFCGLSGGQPLPFRLDHNLSVGMRLQLGSGDQTGTTLRGTDTHLWTRVWESFASRRPLFGPKQFLRISTPVNPGAEDAGDEVIQAFLREWLSPVGFESDLAEWNNVRKEPQS